MRIVIETHNMCENLDRKVGMRVRSVRQELNMPLASLANSVGISAQKLHSYESGLSVLNPSILFRIASVLEVSVATFFPTVTSIEQNDSRGLRGVV